MIELLKALPGESLWLLLFGSGLCGVLAIFGLIGRLAEWMLGEDE